MVSSEFLVAYHRHHHHFYLHSFTNVKVIVHVALISSKRAMRQYFTTS